MKIHFVAALNGDSKDYKIIYDKIKSLGHELVTNHFLKRTLNEVFDESPEESGLYVKRANRWMRQADVVLFETTRPDVSVGYEIATTLNLQKPAIILYRKQAGHPPNSLKGISSDRLQVLAYNDDTLAELLEIALEYAAETADVRFNFFITPTISRYLDWISQTKKLPRSVYLRNLIELDMERNSEYHQNNNHH